jgi:O-methyltransferase involved in polyketide biosynthesis
MTYASRFIARHPEAVGLDLGTGFDTRPARIAPPPTVDWYVTDPAWLDALPTRRPAVITADGLMGFLAEDELISLLDRLIDHFPVRTARGNPSAGIPGCTWSRRC